VTVQIFRWKAVGPLLVFFLILGMLAWIFAEPIAKDTTEEASTELLGTQVDVAKLDLYPKEAAVDLRGLQIADPFTLTRNLIEADEIRLKLNPLALAEKKLVIENLSLSGMRFGTDRKEPARPVKGGGFAPKVYQTVQQWTKQFDVPLLSLTPIDTIRQLALDPSQLTTIRQAEALLARTDSIRTALDQGFRQLDIRPTLDSARALADRVAKANPKQLGVEGTRKAIESVRQTLNQLAAAKKRLEQLESNTRSATGLLGQSLRVVEDARQKDFAFAKSLLKLPTFSAPEIGSAFFGQVSIASSRRCTGPSWPSNTCRRGSCRGRHRAPSGFGRRERRSNFPGRRSFPGFCWSRVSSTSPLGGRARLGERTPPLSAA
jgi:uncharacterized protein (TIGR03545 family)